MLFLERIIDHMAKKITASIGDGEFKIMSGEDFCIMNNVYSAMHRHSFAEVQIVSGGKVKFAVDKQEYELKEGAILIPANVFHHVNGEGAELKRISFLVDKEFKKVSCCEISGNIVSEFMSKLEKQKNVYSFPGFMDYIVFIMGRLSENIPFEVSDTSDYKYVIGEFFAEKYNENLQISDLADELKLSKMQTQRLVKKYTGKTFGENLTAYRMETAEYLMKYSKMPMNKIAEYVGYESYGGFWKAYKKYHNQDIKL